jgi:hypothetical protein
MKVNKEGFMEVVRERFVSDVRWFYPWSPKPELYVAGAVPAFQASDPTAKALKTCRDKVVQYLKVNHEKLTEERVAEHWCGLQGQLILTRITDPLLDGIAYLYNVSQGTP